MEKTMTPSDELVAKIASGEEKPQVKFAAHLSRTIDGQYQIEFVYFDKIVATKTFEYWHPAMEDVIKSGAKFPRGRGPHNEAGIMKHRLRGKYKMHWPEIHGEVKTIIITKPTLWFWLGLGLNIK